MKGSNMYVIISVCVITAVYSFISVIYISTVSSKSEGRHTDKEFPLNYTSGVVVDSEGNIYYGNREYNAVQVYNNIGEYQHYFTFNNLTAGAFNISISEDDIVSVAVIRDDAVLFFKDGYLIEKIIDEEICRMAYHQSKNNPRDEFIDKNGFIYRIVGEKEICVYSMDGSLLRSLVPKTPFWPLPIPIYMCVFGLSLITLILLAFIYAKYKRLREE